MPKKKLPTQDRHRSRFMFRLSDLHQSQLALAAKRARRTVTEEIRIAVEIYLAQQDLWPPPLMTSKR